jgi:hypothetical protein
MIEGENSMKNVLDLTQRLKNQKNVRRAKGAVEHKPAPVVDMTEMRQEILMQERRQVRRTILSEFIGAFVVIPEKGLVKVNLYDISENGMAFDVEADAGHFALNEEVAMRVYLNQQTYFPFVVNIQNLRKVGDEGVFRHGANFAKGTMNEEALYHFVKFIETVSASLKSDQGDIMVSSLAR